jgi:hypothetical protein
MLASSGCYISKANAPTGTPSVTIKVQTPRYRPLSFLKNVSVTTALPIAAAGEMNHAAKALHTIIEAYVLLFAQPILKTKHRTVDRMKIGRRPYRFDKGFQNKGATPKTAIWAEVR